MLYFQFQSQASSYSVQVLFTDLEFLRQQILFPQKYTTSHSKVLKFLAQQFAYLSHSRQELFRNVPWLYLLFHLDQQNQQLVQLLWSLFQD